MTQPEDLRHDEEEPSLARDVGEALADEARTWVRWAGWGAAIGAVVLGAAGFWVIGADAILLAAGVGAVAGGVGAWLLYVNLTSAF